MTTPDERIAIMETKIEYLEGAIEKVESTLESVRDVAHTTKVQLLVGVGLIVFLINLGAKFF